MKRILFCILFGLIGLSLILAAPPFSPRDDDLTKGRKVMEAADEYGEDPYAMISESTMLTVKGDSANPIIRRSVTYRQKLADSESQTLSETVYPSRTKILTFSYPDRDDEIWIKLSSGAPKRISGSGKQGYIQNSHFTYEDMESRDLDQYQFRYLETVSINVGGVSTECYRIESEKISGVESRYSKSNIYIRAGDYLTVRMDMWDLNGNPHKTYRVLRIEDVDGDNRYTIATRFGMSMIDDPTTRANEGKDQYTIIELSSILIDDKAKIDQSVFRKESL